MRSDSLVRRFGTLLALLLLVIPQNARCDEVLDTARGYADGGGYHWVPGNSGTPIAIRFRGEEILPRGQGTICCGFTLAVAIEVAQRRGLLNHKQADDVRAFQRRWYGDTQDSRETLCVLAMQELGIGSAVPLEQALPGDFVQFWRTNGSGHSVVLLDWIREGDQIIGIRYRSSQKATDGIGDREEYFSDVAAREGAVLRSRTHVGRLSPPAREGFSREAASVKESASLQGLIAEGEFALAEEALKRQVADLSAPIVSEAAIELERLRRIRHDFSLKTDEILQQIRQTVPDATLDDLCNWRDAGDLQFRVIDGQTRYFRRAVSNLFRFNAQARHRQQSPTPQSEFDLTALVAELVQHAESATESAIFPVKHHVRYALNVKAEHPRLRAGAVVRAWLPFPQEYRQQSQVRLLKAEPSDAIVADNGHPHRTIYFEQTLDQSAAPPRFAVEFEFVTAAWCPQLDPAAVVAYDTSSALYRQYTSPRPPHILFTPDVRRLANEIVGNQTNPLEKARLIFRWVSQHIPWCAEVEYSTINNLAAHGLAARRGDCGVQSLIFITLCRAAGVPARWQSGWQTQPGNRNMHDWSEFYVEPWGWLPADASYGVRKHPDPRVQDFLCGHLDPYRLIVNLDYGRELQPSKASFRSEPNDFQRGEVEIDGHNLYFDEWDWDFSVETTPLANP
jgi:hypothetical protein